MADIATLGIKVDSSQLSSLTKTLNNVTTAANSANNALQNMSNTLQNLPNNAPSITQQTNAIDRMLQSLKAQELSYKAGKEAMYEYKLGLLGASQGEKDYAKFLLRNIEAIKAKEKANRDALNAEQKRISSIKSITAGLETEVNTIGKSKAQIVDYRLKLLGASDAERAHAKALAEKAQKLEEANSKSKSAADIMAGLATKVSALAAAYMGLNAIKNFANEILNTAKIADNFKYSLLAVSDSSEQAAETYKYLEKEANRLGQSMTANVDSFTGFIASAKVAGLTADQAKKAYTGLNEAMTALHRTPEQASQALYALQQMLSTGTVRSQELSIQLGNAIPGAVPMFAQAMGKTTSELRDLMKDGLVPSNEAVIQFTDYLSNKFGPSAEAASNSVQGSLNKMDNALYNLKKSIVDAMGDNTTGIIKDFTQAIINVTEELKKPETQAQLKRYAEAFISIGKAVKWAGDLMVDYIEFFSTEVPLDTIGTLSEATRLAKEGLIDLNKFYKSNDSIRQQMVKDALAQEREQKASHAENIKYQNEFIESIIDTSKASKKAGETISNNWKPLVGIQVQLSEKEKEHEKEIKKITDSIEEQALAAGKSAEEAKRDKLISLGMSKEEANAQYEIMMASKAKNDAVKEAASSARKAEQEAESARKKAETAELNRQKAIDGVITKLKEQIAIYNEGKEVTAEYQLKNLEATDKEILLAKSLGKTLDALKEKKKVQDEYNKLMDKTAPEQVEMKRANALELVQKQFEITKGSVDEYGKAIAQINQYYDDLENKDINSQLKETTKTLEDLYKVKGTNFGNELADGINNAITSMHDLNEVFEDNIKIQKNMEKAQTLLATGKGSPEERAEATKTLAEGEEAMTKKSLSGYRQLFGTISQLYGENTKEREALHKIEMAFAAAEIAMNLEKTISAAYVAITTQGAGDPYTAFARVAAMTALMAGIVSAAGGSLGGSKGGGSASASSASSNGSTVLGSSEGSQSISNSLDFMTDIESKQYNELKGINDGVESLNKNITGLVTSIVRNVDVGSVQGAVSGTSGGTSYTQDMGVKSASYLMSLGTTMWLDFYAGVYDKVPILGNMISSVSDFVDDTISSISNAVFGGSKKTTILAQGLEVSTGKISDLLDGMGADIQKFADIKIKKEGGLFDSDKTYYKTLYEDLNDDSIKTMFTSVFKSMGETMVAISKGLNLGEDNLKQILEYSFDIGKLDLKGLDSEGINKAVSEAISAAGDTAVQALFGELISQYQQVGEGLLETAIRVVSEKGVVEDILSMTNQAFDNAAIPEIALATTQSIIDLAGGIKQLQESSSTYFNEFFTDAEKQSRLYSQLSGAMASINLPMAENRDAFRAMVEGLDLNTESGRQQYVALLSMSEAADKYYDALENGEKTTKDNSDAITSMVADTQKAIDQMDMSDFDKSIQNVKDSTENQIATLRSLGASEEDIAVIRAYGQKQINQLNQDEKERIQNEKDRLKAENESAAAVKNAAYITKATKQMELDILNGLATEQDRVNLQRQKELKALPDEVKAIQQAIWIREDEISAAEKAKQILDEKTNLELRILELTGNTAEYTAKKRQLEIESINEANKPLQERIWALEDEADAAAKAKDILNEKQNLELQILKLTGSETEYLAAQRRMELESIDDSNKSLQKRIWELEDEALKAKEAADAAELLKEERIKAEEKAASILEQRYRMEIELLKLMGNETAAIALERKLELESLDDSLKGLQQRIWALEDEKEAAEKAAEAQKAAEAAEKERLETILEGYKKISDERKDLEKQLAQLEGGLTATRQMELDSLDESNRELQRRVWHLQDEIEAQEKLNSSISNVKDTLSNLQDQYDQLTGNEASLRQKEIDGITETSKALHERLEALQDEKDISTELLGTVRDSKNKLSEELQGLSTEHKKLLEEFNRLRAEKRKLEGGGVTDAEKDLYDSILADMDAVVLAMSQINDLRRKAGGELNKYLEEEAKLILGIDQLTPEISAIIDALAEIDPDTTAAVELQEKIWELEDAMKAAEKAAEIASKRQGLEIQILELTGKSTEALAIKRAIELESLDDSLKPLQERIWALEDEADAAEKAAEAIEKAKEIQSQKQSLEIELMRLTGNESGALAKERELELASMDESLWSLQRRIWAIEDEKTAYEEMEETVKDTAKKAVDYFSDIASTANDKLSDAKTALEKAFSAQEDYIVSEHKKLIDSLTERLNEAQESASSLEDAFNSVTSARKSMESSGSKNYFDVQRQLFSTLIEARAGDFSNVPSLMENIDVVTSNNEDMFASQADYKRNFYRTYNALTELGTLTGETLTEQEQVVKNLESQIEQSETQHQALIDSLKIQLNGILGVDSSVFEVNKAITLFKQAQEEANKANNDLSMAEAERDRIDLEYSEKNTTQFNTMISELVGISSSSDITAEKLTSLNDYLKNSDNESLVSDVIESKTILGYANGGIHEGGLRIVGERGAELEYTAPARITSNNDLKSMMSDEDVKRILSEIKEEIARGNFAIAKNTQDSAKVLKKFDYDGMPETRT